jgi:hypothetical protein
MNAVLRYPLPANFPITVGGWTQLGGPGSVVFGDSLAASTTVTFPGPGTYELAFSLSQQDNRDSENVITYNGADSVLVTIPATPADTDGDELPDLWEDEHFGNDDGTPTPGELAESDGSGDFDGDGTPDLAEFRLGLIPTDATSAFTLDVSPGLAADTVELSWPSQEGLHFEIYLTDNLSLPLANWSVTPPITDDDDDGAPTHEWTDEDAASSPMRFYRVGLLP